MNRVAMTVADIVDAAAKGRIGHREAIERLGLKTYPELVETMHANGRKLWAHRAPGKIEEETLELLRLACSPFGRSAELRTGRSSKQNARRGGGSRAGRRDTMPEV